MDSKKLASILSESAGIADGGVGKTAGVLDKTDHPFTNTELQGAVGDPDDVAVSSFAQFNPNPGTKQLPNPLSPIEGDEIFFMYLIPGSIFQANDGSMWEIEDYEWDGRIEVINVWYPRQHANVSVNDIRRAIHAWVMPIQATVPPPPEGVDYGAQLVRVVE